MNAKIIDMEERSFEETQKSLKGIVNEMGFDSESEKIIDDFVSFFAILELPDDKFEAMSKIVLSELEKAFNDNNTKLMLTQSLNLNGLKSEDLIEYYVQLSDTIEETFKDKYDKKRIDFIKSVFILVINSITETEGIPKRNITIPIQICKEGAKIPSYANIGDAGLDIYALEDYEIKPGETKLIPTGLKVAIPHGYELQVRPKSGRSLKTKLRVANTPGTIDSGYRDEIGVIIENVEAPIKAIDYEFDVDGKPIIKSIEHGSSYFIGKGEKFAQLILSEVPTAIFQEVEDINIYGDNRGGGFGSSGLK